MENSEKSALPIMDANLHANGEITLESLTKREYFAGLAMQGLCANQNYQSILDPLTIPSLAVQITDELLKQLEP